jgi:hypothetical protein
VGLVRNPYNITTTAYFSTYGDYVLRLITNDGELISNDDVRITVNPPPNQAPTVDAGNDKVIHLPDDATLDGTVWDDSLPDPPAAVSTTWSKVSGPGTVTFANVSSIDTTASFSTAGNYVLRLTADDSGLTNSDDVFFIVKPASNQTNQEPIVNAGSVQTISIASDATLDGTVTDDGLPDPPGTVTTTWSKLIGPGEVAFGDDSLLDTTASFSKEGVYTLRLTAYDGEMSSIDDVTITVRATMQVWLPLIME